MMSLWYVLICMLKQDIFSIYGEGELGWVRLNERRVFVVFSCIVYFLQQMVIAYYQHLS